MIGHETMTDELTELLEKRQYQIFKERTDLYGRFRSPKDEAFFEGYVECMQDVHYFFEDKKMEEELKLKAMDKKQD